VRPHAPLLLPRHNGLRLPPRPQADRYRLQVLQSFRDRRPLLETRLRQRLQRRLRNRLLRQDRRHPQLSILLLPPPLVRQRLRRPLPDL
jgi:hypothetical protein